MTIYMMEMRNTEQWSDCRYREYTTSRKKAAAFLKVPKIQFTDSGHGVVPHVEEVKSKKLPRIVSGIFCCAEWVGEPME